jgi:hypothetical protein
VPFTRPTLIAAVELLEQHSQARSNQMVLRLGLEDKISTITSLSVDKKCAMLGRIVVHRAEAVLDTLEGSMTLNEYPRLGQITDALVPAANDRNSPKPPSLVSQTEVQA